MFVRNLIESGANIGGNLAYLICSCVQMCGKIRNRKKGGERLYVSFVRTEKIWLEEVYLVKIGSE